MDTYRIDTKTGRDQLAPRRNPYYKKVRENVHLGFRKLRSGGGTWTARARDDTGQDHWKKLGDLTPAFGFNEALRESEKYATQLEQGITGKDDHGREATVTTACREYVQSLHATRPEAAQDAHRRFERTVYGREKAKYVKPVAPHCLATRKLAGFRAKWLDDWRDEQLARRLNWQTINRNMTALKAALNMAVDTKLTGRPLADECRLSKPLTGVGGRREIYLDLDQRRALYDAAAGSERDLIEATSLLGPRLGELTKARRSQFDARTKTLTLYSRKGKGGKVRERKVPLSLPAMALLTRLSRDKLPGAFLFTRDDGQPWGHSAYDELIREAAKKANLPEGTCLYAVRHSFITDALLGGMVTLTVARIVGTSVQMIEKHYGHLVDQNAREQLAAIAFL